ncbi:PD-(D/E)XK nuclease family protein [Oerskovia sp. NPDC060338]|uniref:PD-(D/E)XK nuclease family protein n=1 Tax=Oerskovia sp. NPDC060338 TaxID=3347100 RepID=UPI00366222B1
MSALSVSVTHRPDARPQGLDPEGRVRYQGGDPAPALGELRDVIEHAITHHPRSLQRTIGPSEIGTPCEHCLAAKLAGWEQTRDGIPWLPTIGTATHAWLEDAFIAHELDRNRREHVGFRWVTEERVMVGHIGGREIWGSTDLLDTAVGMTVDWKVVGSSTLKAAKAGPSPVYRVQADLYAKGWNDAGVRVDHVAIAYLPRNAVSLDQAVWWHAPHDRARAEQALARAERLHTNLAALESISTAARDAWITQLPRDARCYDCARFPDGAHLTAPGHTNSPQAAFSDLLG